MAELAAERADTSCGRDHDHRFALGDPADGPVQVPGRQPLDHQRECRVVIQTVGDRRAVPLGHCDVFGVAARLADRDDPFPRVFTDTCHLGARDQRKGVLGDVRVAARVRVGEVDSGTGDADQDFSRCRHRPGDLYLLEYLGAAELTDLDRAHGASL